MANGLVNVFEDDHTIREGCWLKAVRECDVIPEDYGVCWYRPTEAVAICAPMPFHTLLGWAYRAYWHWRARWGLSAATLPQRAFVRGVESERQHAERHMAFVLAQHDAELKRQRLVAWAQGRREGQRETMAAVRQEFLGGAAGDN